MNKRIPNVKRFLQETERDSTIHKFLVMIIQRRQVVMYAIIGVVALGLEMLCFFLLTAMLGASIPISNAFAMAAGLVLSFSLNAKFTFMTTDRLLVRFFSFASVTFFGYLLSTSIILAGVEYGGLSPLLAKVISLPVFFFFQYNCNRLLTFR